MDLNISYYVINIIVQILGVIFAIRICSFKKDAWYYYFLATIIGSLQPINFGNFSISEYLGGLPPFCHDLLLSLIAILILQRFNIKPQKISKHNLLQVSILIVIITILMVMFEYLTLSISSLSNIMYFIADTFGIFAFVGSALLILGYILGLLISAIFSLQAIIMAIIFAIEFNNYTLNLLISILFNVICLIIFTHGYIKNKKLLSTY